MDRVDAILAHGGFREAMEKNALAELDRPFCRHDLGHSLDVARLAWIDNLERGLDQDRERVYAAALLHDIGRHEQYARGIPHERAAIEPAGEILADCGFGPEAIESILAAISGHRDSAMAMDMGLPGLLYRADKASRACFACPAEGICDWGEEKKNRKIRG